MCNELWHLSLPREAVVVQVKHAESTFCNQDDGHLQGQAESLGRQTSPLLASAQERPEHHLLKRKFQKVFLLHHHLLFKA